MKEHSLFLLAGFPARETEFIRRADQYRKEFEEGLSRTVKLADGIVSKSVLNSGEVVTEFTQKAECRTELAKSKGVEKWFTLLGQEQATQLFL